MSIQLLLMNLCALATALSADSIVFRHSDQAMASIFFKEPIFAAAGIERVAVTRALK